MSTDATAAGPVSSVRQAELCVVILEQVLDVVRHDDSLRQTLLAYPSDAERGVMQVELDSVVMSLLDAIARARQDAILGPRTPDPAPVVARPLVVSFGVAGTGVSVTVDDPASVVAGVVKSSVACVLDGVGAVRVSGLTQVLLSVLGYLDGHGGSVSLSDLVKFCMGQLAGLARSEPARPPAADVARKKWGLDDDGGDSGGGGSRAS